MIRLQDVRSEDRELLWNIHQKYLYEMTNYYPDVMDDQGNYRYGHFEGYFTDPARKALFIFDDETLVGFAMLCPYSYLGHHPDYTMAEFTVFPAYRRKHAAFEAAGLILRTFPGRWEIKYNEGNTAAKKLWKAVTASCFPAVHRLNEQETVLEFDYAAPDGGVVIRDYTDFCLEEVLGLYSAVGWINYVSRSGILREAYRKSLCVLGAYHGDRLIGIARAVGDGYSIVFIQDVLVLPEYQRRGTGTRLVKALLERFKTAYQVELMTDGTEKTKAFYRSVGFTPADEIGCLSYVRFGPARSFCFADAPGSLKETAACPAADKEEK